jgi:hypothetical protein
MLTNLLSQLFTFSNRAERPRPMHVAQSRSMATFTPTVASLRSAPATHMPANNTHTRPEPLRAPSRSVCTRCATERSAYTASAESFCAKIARRINGRRGSASASAPTPFESNTADAAALSPKIAAGRSVVLNRSMRKRYTPNSAHRSPHVL